MSSDFERLFDELARVLGNLTEFAGPRRVEGTHSLTAKVTVRVGYLDDLARMKRPRGDHEPLVDVIEGEDSYRVVVLLPRVKSQDVKVIPREGTLRVEVERGSTVYIKEVPCDSPPRKISVISAKENNSVVELLFAKEAGRR
jgi:HSP20 family molecular chaperone IbpA